MTNLLELNIYYKYYKGSVNDFEKYVENGLLKISSDPIPKNSIQGLRFQKNFILNTLPIN